MTRCTPSSSHRESRTQCSAAFENTASNSRANGNCSASITRASRSASPGRGYHFLGGIDGDDSRTCRDNPFSERALAAADSSIRSRPGIQQLEDGVSERGDIGGIGPVGITRPAVHARVIVPARERSCATLPSHARTA